MRRYESKELRGEVKNPSPYSYSFNWYTGTLTVWNRWGVIAEISECENMSAGRIDRLVDEIIDDYEVEHGKG